MGFQRHFHGDNLIQLTATYTGAKQHILGQHILGLALPPLLQMADVRLGNREVIPATTEGPENVFTQKPFTLMKRRY